MVKLPNRSHFRSEQGSILVDYILIIIGSPEKNYLFFITIQLQIGNKNQEIVTICNLFGGSAYQPAAGHTLNGKGAMT